MQLGLSRRLRAGSRLLDSKKLPTLALVLAGAYGWGDYATAQPIGTHTGEYQTIINVLLSLMSWYALTTMAACVFIMMCHLVRIPALHGMTAPKQKQTYDGPLG